MDELLINNPRGVCFAFFGLISGLSLLGFAIITMIQDFRGKIRKETNEFKEHLVIGVSALLMLTTVYATDFNNGLDYWLTNVGDMGGMMAMQYLMGGILSISLIYHLKERHHD